MEDRSLKLSIDYTDPPLITAAGDLDYHTCGEMETFISRALDRSSVVRLELADLVFVDSSGLKVLLSMAQKARDAGGVLEVLSMSAQLDRVLTLSGFARLFELPDAAARVPTLAIHHAQVARELAFDIPCEKNACGVARDRVCRFASALSLDHADLDDLRLAVGEAVSNAVKHAAEPEDSIQVLCDSHDGRIRVTIRYPGAEFDPECIPVPTADSGCNGGMGIYFMRLVMDSVDYDFRDGVTTVTLTKRLRD